MGPSERWAKTHRATSILLAAGLATIALLTTMPPASAQPTPPAASTAAPPEALRPAFDALGRGDVVRAMSLARSAAEAGSVPAQAFLAELLDKSGFVEEAFEWFGRAARAGSPEGQLGLGVMYAAARGTARDFPAAREWIGRAADQGHGPAIDLLAKAYLDGELGLGRDARRNENAIPSLEKAARNDFLPAIDYLARAYRTGTGVPADPARAQALEARAAALRGTTRTARTSRP